MEDSFAKATQLEQEVRTAMSKQIETWYETVRNVIPKA